MDTSFGMFTHFICKHEIFYANLTSVIIIGQKRSKEEHASGDPFFLHHVSYNAYKTYRLHFLCKRNS